MRRTYFTVFFLFVVAQSLFSLDFWDKEAPEVLAIKLSIAMSPEELAAQMLMLGFPTDTPSLETEAWVQQRMVGGIKIFGWNATSPEAVARAVRKLQSDSQKTRFRIPLLIATDQEGGWVRHIKGTTSSTPGNLAIGASGLPYDAWKTGNLIGLELGQMGVNMNFAPSIDLYTNPDAFVIGPRSFSQDPVQAGVLGSAFIRGLMDAGIIPTAKHFPGHGNTPEDSHGSLPILNDDLETLKARELVPYRMLIKEGLPSVMTGHLAFPKITGNKIPASLSPDLTQKILREDMGFDKVVITDDLYMEGARPEGWTQGETAERAVLAGNDILLISQPSATQLISWNSLVSKAQREPDFLVQLRRSVVRILEMKLRFLKGPGAIPLLPNPAALVLPNPGSDEFFFQQALRSAVALQTGGLPWSTSEEDTLVVTPYDSFYQVFVRKFPGATKLEYDYDFFSYDKAFARNLRSRAESAKRIILNLITPGSLGYLKVLEPFKEKLAVVSVLTPVYLRDFPWIKTSIAVFGTNEACYETGASILAGDFQARGKLPLRFGDFPWKNP